MGLRELKTKRTRAAIAAAALELFERQGYDATTMEQIAEAAEVAPTTLYRYFPTKDSTLSTQVTTEAESLGAMLTARPADESLDVALGHVLGARLAYVDARSEHILRLRRQIDLVPAARARVWDTGYQELSSLQRAIAARAGVDPAETWVQVTAHTAIMIYQMALDGMRATPEPLPATEQAAAVIDALGRGTFALPTLPAPPG